MGYGSIWLLKERNKVKVSAQCPVLQPLAAHRRHHQRGVLDCQALATFKACDNHVLVSVACRNHAGDHCFAWLIMCGRWCWAKPLMMILLALQQPQISWSCTTFTAATT